MLLRYNIINHLVNLKTKNRKIKKLKNNKYKPIIISSLIIIILLALVELCSYFIVYNKYKKDINSMSKADKTFNANLTYEKAIYPSYAERKNRFRPISLGKDAEKTSIVLFGDSFTWGSHLKDDETFSAVLSDYTGRTVYNRGLYATGIPFMYYQLKDRNITNEIANPQYFIYTLIDNHFYRSLTVRSWCKDPIIQYRYKVSDGKLVLVKPTFKFLYPLYSVFLLQNYIQNLEYKKLLFKEPVIKMIDESNRLIKKKFPNSEFIILVYQDSCWGDSYLSEKQQILNHFSDEGIKVIYTDDLIGKNVLKDKKYLSADNFHPSCEAWKLIVPKLVKALDIK